LTACATIEAMSTRELDKYDIAIAAFWGSMGAICALGLAILIVMRICGVHF
jgi:hypothetical protein